MVDRLRGRLAQPLPIRLPGRLELTLPDPLQPKMPESVPDALLTRVTRAVTPPGTDRTWRNTASTANTSVTESGENSTTNHEFQTT